MYGSIPIGSALAGVLGAAAGTHAGVAPGTIGLALSALPMLVRRIRELPTPSAAQIPDHKIMTTHLNDGRIRYPACCRHHWDSAGRSTRTHNHISTVPELSGGCDHRDA
jgi:hypothetical protein